VVTSGGIISQQALRLQVRGISRYSVDDLTAIGSAALVVLATAGSTNSVRTISAHLLTYGEQPSGVVILERRYGPRRLRDDDNDDDGNIAYGGCRQGVSYWHVPGAVLDENFKGSWPHHLHFSTGIQYQCWCPFIKQKAQLSQRDRASNHESWTNPLQGTTTIELEPMR